MSTGVRAFSQRKGHPRQDANRDATGPRNKPSETPSVVIRRRRTSSGTTRDRARQSRRASSFREPLGTQRAPAATPRALERPRRPASALVGRLDGLGTRRSSSRTTTRAEGMDGDAATEGEAPRAVGDARDADAKVRRVRSRVSSSAADRAARRGNARAGGYYRVEANLHANLHCHASLRPPRVRLLTIRKPLVVFPADRLGAAADRRQGEASPTSRWSSASPGARRAHQTKPEPFQRRRAPRRRARRDERRSRRDGDDAVHDGVSRCFRGRKKKER